mmetsp:Transcript_14542/g.36927  ORF Transcript_14542/g.36927 Transcript_14542/m.36927 type:complete len:230 (-) Transcript_14542:1133-1822(-)
MNSPTESTQYNSVMRSSSVASAATESTKVASLAWASTGPVKTRRNLEGKHVDGKEKLRGDLKRTKTPESLWFFGKLLQVIAKMLQASKSFLGLSSSTEGSPPPAGDFKLPMPVPTARSRRARERSNIADSGKPLRKDSSTKFTASMAFSALMSSATEVGVMSCWSMAKAPTDTRGRCTRSVLATLSSSKPFWRRCVIRHLSVDAKSSSTSMKKLGASAIVESNWEVVKV